MWTHNFCSDSHEEKKKATVQEFIFIIEMSQRANEMEVAAYKDKIDLLRADLSAKDEELKELLGAVECLQSKVFVCSYEYNFVETHLLFRYSYVSAG